MINSPLYINYQTIFTKVHIFHSLKSCNQIPLTPILESPKINSLKCVTYIGPSAPLNLSRKDQGIIQRCSEEKIGKKSVG